ncbi:MAG: ABC transporter ATP-binding protein [Alphaproteobacteria bacterium]|nr:ABC transporter ATP-binding protein [Alphaproteobacteria bacterium]
MPPPPAVPAIEVDNLSIRYGHVTAVETVSFTVEPGRQLTLLGPSGCGKTSTLRAVAGLERPTAGAIRIGGRPVFDSSAGINVPAEQRGMSMVFQSYAIWPHMTVFENVAYGLRVRKESGKALDEKVRHALELVKMGAYADRNASQLSGGQQQRVALARACAFQPSVLLFDEPLSNLDAKLRAEMRIELRELQRRIGVTSLYVTHDLEEALAMSDRIVVMRQGLVEQAGTPGDIYNHPRTEFVADFVGSANLVDGEVVAERTTADRITLRVDGMHLVEGVTRGRRHGGTATLSLRTVHLKVGAARPAGDTNVWPVELIRSVFLGDMTQLHLRWGKRELIARQTGPAPVADGAQAWLQAAPETCILLDPAR